MPVVMVVVSVLLVVLPLYQQPWPSLTGFGIGLLGVPVYVFFVMETPWRLRPRVFDRISGKLEATLYIHVACSAVILLYLHVYIHVHACVIT